MTLGHFVSLNIDLSPFPELTTFHTSWNLDSLEVEGLIPEWSKRAEAVQSMPVNFPVKLEEEWRGLPPPKMVPEKAQAGKEFPSALSQYLSPPLRTSLLLLIF